jgi:hypothetical protein
MTDTKSCSTCDAVVTPEAGAWIDSTGFEDASHPYPHEHDGAGQ